MGRGLRAALDGRRDALEKPRALALDFRMALGGHDVVRVFLEGRDERRDAAIGLAEIAVGRRGGQPRLCARPSVAVLHGALPVFGRREDVASDLARVARLEERLGLRAAHRGARGARTLGDERPREPVEIVGGAAKRHLVEGSARSRTLGAQRDDAQRENLRARTARPYDARVGEDSLHLLLGGGQLAAIRAKPGRGETCVLRRCGVRRTFRGGLV